MPDWLWAIIYYVPTVIIGTSLGIVGSLGTGIGCIFGRESACGSFPEYFMLIVRLGPPLVGMVLLAHVVVYPRASLQKLRRTVAWLHYFFVPHPAEAAIQEGRRYRTPEKIDPKAVVDAIQRDPAFDTDPRNMPPAYQSENKRRRAEELQKAAEADRKLLVV